MRQRRILYRWKAGVKPNNLPQTESKSVQRLWSNLPSSKISPVIPNTPSTEDSDFLSFDATGKYLIPSRSWRRAQQSPAIRFRIRGVVVEESAIEFWDCHSIYKTTLKRVSDFLSFDATETPFIPLDSWHRAQEHPGIGFRIECLAVVEGCSCDPGVWILSVVMKRVRRVASGLRLSAKNPPGSMLDLRVLWLSLAFRLQ